MRNPLALLCILALICGLMTGLCSCKKAQDLDATDEAPEGVTSATGTPTGGPGANTGAKGVAAQKRPAPTKR